jgi:hypothetical protein
MPHIPTCTSRTEPTILNIGIPRKSVLQRRLPTITTLKIASSEVTRRGSTMQQHVEQLPEQLPDRASKRRKRQRCSGEPSQPPHPHTISRLTELLGTCTDAQYIQIIKSLPTDWSATNDRGKTITKRQLEMAQWESYKDDHIVLTFQQTIMLTRQISTTVTQYDTLLAQSIVEHNDVWLRQVTNPLTGERL